MTSDRRGSRHTARRRRAVAGRQRGIALIEALVAFLVLSLGMVLIAKMQFHLRLQSDQSRQRTEAVRLAQREIEKLRAFSVVAATSGARAYADIATAEAIADGAGYTLSRDVDAVTWAHTKAVSVNVSWIDRTGAVQRILLKTMIDGGDPAMSGALSLKPSAAGQSVTNRRNDSSTTAAADSNAAH